MLIWTLWRRIWHLPFLYDFILLLEEEILSENERVEPPELCVFPRVKQGILLEPVTISNTYMFLKYVSMQVFHNQNICNVP